MSCRILVPIGDGPSPHPMKPRVLPLDCQGIPRNFFNIKRQYWQGGEGDGLDLEFRCRGPAT